MQCQYQETMSTMIRRGSPGGGNNAAGQVESVHGGEDIDKETAGTAGEVKTEGRQLAPDQKLSGEKEETESCGQSEPGKMPFVSERDAGNGSDWSERGFSRDLAAGEVDRKAAEYENGRVRK